MRRCRASGNDDVWPEMGGVGAWELLCNCFNVRMDLAGGRAATVSTFNAQACKEPHAVRKTLALLT